MKKLLLIILFNPLFSFAQQYNDFENNLNLDIVIDTTIPGNIWQIGQPQKVSFNSAYSVPNAIVTDTSNNIFGPAYGVFQFRVDMSTLWAFPYFVIIWKQKIDSNFKIDGGWIEASYDTGTTWVNVFTDTVYQPVIAGGSSVDTLANGEVGFTGIDTSWKSMIMCWGNGTGNPPFPINNVMDIRYIFWTDTIMVNSVEGWILDNFEAYPTLIDFMSEIKNDKLQFLLYPNPAGSEINFQIQLHENSDLLIEVLGINGETLKIIDNIKGKSGINNIRISLSDLNISDNILIMRCKTEDKVISSKFIRFE